jgi:hypothetical protein
MAEVNQYQAPEEFNRLRTIFLGLGGIAVIAWGVGLFMSPEQGLRSWLLGFIFWGGISIGSLGILMLQYLTGGAWGVVIRRILESSTRTLVIVALAFVPIAVGVTTLYEWTHLPADDFTQMQRGAYQTPFWWIVRSVVYFAVLGLTAYLLTSWSARQDNSADHEEAAKWLGRSTKFSGPAIIFYVLVVSFLSVDWVMSLDPHWFSTMYGLLFVIGWALSTMCFTVIVLHFASLHSPMNRVLGKRHFHDVGKLMLAFVMVWTYFNFSQYLIIWSGNIPEETPWYLTRISHGWQWVGWTLLLFHFAFPFLILLQQDFKRYTSKIAWLAGFILVMRLIDSFYLISPNPRIATHGESLSLVASFSWMDIVAPVALGGFWLWYFFGQLAKRPIVPVMDPFFEKAIEHGRGH